MGLTREKAKELLPIINGFVDGGTLQFKYLTESWHDTDHIDVDATDVVYRIKPEPKFRPFKSQEECWQEMHKHPNFGWVKEKASEIIYNISGISKLSIVILEDISSFKEAFDIYQFEDGEPFGIKEE